MLSGRKSKGIRVSSLLVLIFIVVAVICVSSAIRTTLLTESNLREYDAVTGQLESVEQNNEELERYSKSEFFNEYMEDRARAIGYARPNEQVYYITPN
jgi:hypothetical protein